MCEAGLSEIVQGDVLPHDERCTDTKGCVIIHMSYKDLTPHPIMSWKLQYP